MKHLDGPTGGYIWTLEINLLISPAIMLQLIVILHWPPLSVMISSNFRILKIDYLHIHHTSLSLLILCNSQT